jgi:hypothetical protein
MLDRSYRKSALLVVVASVLSAPGWAHDPPSQQARPTIVQEPSTAETGSRVRKLDGRAAGPRERRRTVVGAARPSLRYPPRLMLGVGY